MNFKYHSNPKIIKANFCLTILNMNEKNVFSNKLISFLIIERMAKILVVRQLQKLLLKEERKNLKP